MKNIKRKPVLPLIALLLGLAALAEAAIADTQASRPSARHRKWLEEEVVYIISPVERKVFLQLQSDRERDLFIEAFWKHRDPTPGTPENEFKEEHAKRLAHVNRIYGRSAPMPGWRTDRGRIYVILGEPMSVLHYDNNPELRPCEVWYYQGLTRLGLPDGLQLIFYQEGAGDFQLYRPAQDGPMALIQNWKSREAPNDFEGAYERLAGIEINLASPSLSVDPADTTNSYGHPSPSSEVLMNKVAVTPWKRIEDQYAGKFLEYKDRVEVEYSTNWVPSSGQLFIQPDAPGALSASGIAWVHYAIELKNLALDTYEDKYFTALKVSGNVSTPEGLAVFQFDKTASLNLSEAQLQEARSQPFTYRDLFPLIPGRYLLTVLVKNETSKEFTSLERTIEVPEAGAGARISPLLLGYRVATPAADAGLRPFQFGPYQVYSQPGFLFVRQDSLAAAFQVTGLDKAQRANAVIHWTILRDNRPFMDKSRPLGEFAALPYCLETIPLAPLDPAYYTLRIALQADGRELASADAEFAVSPQQVLPRPWFYSRSQPAAGDPQFMHVVGSQFFRAGKAEPARKWLEQAFALNPGSADIAQDLAKVYLAAGEAAKVIQLLAPFLADEKKATYDMLLTGSQAWLQTGEYARALENYTAAISRFGINTVLLNAIGGCYLKLGRPGDAVAAWEKSLQLDPGQEEIRKQVDALKGRK
jgi:GWxTD domain-containing protein